jgi:hypothetical protein
MTTDTATLTPAERGTPSEVIKRLTPAEERKVLRTLTGNPNSSPKEAFEKFESLNLDFTNLTKEEKKKVDAKVLLGINETLWQINERKSFNIPEIIDFKNVCKTCQGLGAKLRVLRSSEQKPCKKCKNGITKEGKKCISCLTSPGVYTKYHLFPALESFNECPSCKGVGYHKSTTPDNPVLTEDLAQYVKTSKVEE